VAVAALLLWLGTAAVGSYLLATSVRSGNIEPAPEESVPVPGPATAAPVTGPQRPVRARDRFDPPSLQRAKSEPVPGLKELAEFAHPALAMIGVGFWIGYVVSRDRLFAAIGLGVLLGAICAGVSWFAANTRAAKRAAGAGAGAVDASAMDRSTGDRGTVDRSTGDHRAGPLSASPRLLILHALGAILTLLFAVLIAVRA
jgi:hypothetical protein